MTQWATFRSYVTQELHVLPVDERGYILPPHELHYGTQCPCKPRRDDSYCELIVHADKERGGFDS